MRPPLLPRSRAQEAHASRRPYMEDQTSLDILIRDRISYNHRVPFQWVPSQVEDGGNKKASFLARTAAKEEISTCEERSFHNILLVESTSEDETLR
ncbi:hypothetical protein TNCV_1577301 [Trichonephila clavipes]|nr:hypothetical protein TNCV_1577301 [Trichonephila clavipes]